MSKCPVCGKLFFKFHSLQEHGKTHDLKLSGKLQNRISLETPVTVEFWMEQVQSHIEKFGKNRTSWMRFLIGKLVKHRKTTNGGIEILVRWAAPYDHRRYDTYEKMSKLEEDCLELVMEYCLEKGLERLKKEESARIKKEERKDSEKLKVEKMIKNSTEVKILTKQLKQYKI